jgi:multiple sugar transport system substrate-binding protein
VKTDTETNEEASSSNNNVAKPAEPVTLTIGVPTWSNGEYDGVLVPAVAQKFPNVKLEKVDIGGNNKFEENILAKSLKLDIIITGVSSNYLISLKETGLSIDMASLAKAVKLNLAEFDKARMEVAYNADGNSDLTVIPYSLDTAALYYNKDIFDRFGVAYPKDHMTWQQVIDLGKKVTRSEDGIQYRGIEVNAVNRSALQLGLLTVDPKTQKAAVNTDGWKQFFTLMKSAYDIPGNGALIWFGPARDRFAKTKDIAMLVENGPDGFDTYPDLNWNLVTYPVYSNAPETTWALGGRGFSITSFSPHKQEAFDLIKWWVSDEVQNKLSASGVAPALDKPEVLKSFGTARSGFKGKNLQALLALEPAKQPQNSEYEPDVVKVIRDAFTNMIKSTK